MKKRRVVVTGLGVTAANAIGVSDYLTALQSGTSGIKYWEELKKLNLRCQIGGVPNLSSIELSDFLPRLFSQKITNKGIIYACLAGLEAWKDAGLDVSKEKPDYSSGIIMGAGDLSFDSLLTGEPAVYPVDRGDARRLGSRTIPENMNSGASAHLNAILGFGNRVLSNSSACSTGSEAVLLGYEYLSSGRAERMLCGSTEGDGRYIWGSFDAMRVLCGDSNDNPSFGSRPMNADSTGFVPSGGSGALVLETLESAEKRGANIYAEILGGSLNSGGQREGGSMTSANSQAVKACIRGAMNDANIVAEEIDLISGHLTSTKGDPVEIRNWTEVLKLEKSKFPYINTPKSMIGHAVAGSGSIELVASVLQLKHNFIHANLNTEELHPQIAEMVYREKIPQKCLDVEVNTLIKANFGFGDINCSLVLKKFTKYE